MTSDYGPSPITIKWPTLLTLAMFPVFVVMYVRLARQEERGALREFGDPYRRYMADVLGLFSHDRAPTKQGQLLQTQSFYALSHFLSANQRPNDTQSLSLDRGARTPVGDLATIIALSDRDLLGMGSRWRKNMFQSAVMS